MGHLIRPVLAIEVLVSRLEEAVDMCILSVVLNYSRSVVETLLVFAS